MVKKLILLVLVLLGALLFISCKNNSTNTNSNTTNNTQTPQPETPKVARQLGLDNWDDYLSYTYTTSPAADGMYVCTFTFTPVSSDFIFVDCQIFINYATGGYHKVPKSGNLSFSVTIEAHTLTAIKIRDVKGYVIVPQA